MLQILFVEIGNCGITDEARKVFRLNEKLSLEKLLNNK